jgi:hypothetical protein
MERCTGTGFWRILWQEISNGKWKMRFETNFRYNIKITYFCVWIGLTWPRIGSSAGILWSQQWIFGFYETRGIFLLAERLLVSEEGLFSIELVTISDNTFALRFANLRSVPICDSIPLLCFFIFESVLVLQLSVTSSWWASDLLHRGMCGCIPTFLINIIPSSPALKMEAVGSSETLIYSQKTVRHNNQEHHGCSPQWKPASLNLLNFLIHGHIYLSHVNPWLYYWCNFFFIFRLGHWTVFSRVWISSSPCSGVLSRCLHSPVGCHSWYTVDSIIPSYTVFTLHLV